MKVAFLGLGKMGSAMARNLLQGGYEVMVYNRTRGKAEALAGDGARVAASPAEAVRECEIAMTMVADDRAVEEFVFGDQGIAAALPAGAVHAGCSTISTALARRLSEEHGKRGQHYVSSPVFGRPDAAAAKRLLVVAAGPHEVLARCQALFDSIGRQTFMAGVEPWQANAVKVCGNFMIVSMVECFGEAYATLRKANVDPHLFLEVMNALFASPVYANYGRIIAEEQFEPAGFALKLGLKDITLALATARECAAPMPVASVLHDQFLSAIAQGDGEADWSAVTRVAARNAGL